MARIILDGETQQLVSDWSRGICKNCYSVKCAVCGARFLQITDERAREYCHRCEPRMDALNGVGRYKIGLQPVPGAAKSWKVDLFDWCMSGLGLKEYMEKVRGKDDGKVGTHDV